MVAHEETLEDKLLLRVYRSLPLDNLYHFLLDVPTPVPLDGKAVLSVTQTETGKEMYAIYGEHYSSEALRLMHEEIRPLAERNPEKWLFLIEGSPTSSIPEVIYGYMLGERLGIPTENPVIDPYSREVIEKAVEKGIKRDDVYVALSLGAFSLYNIRDDLDDIVSKLSHMWNIPFDHLKGLLILTGLEAGRTDDGVEKKKEEIRRIQDELGVISNYLSSQRLEKILEKYPEKNALFAYVGGNHKVILEKL